MLLLFLLLAVSSIDVSAGVELEWPDCIAQKLGYHRVETGDGGSELPIYVGHPDLADSPSFVINASYGWNLQNDCLQMHMERSKESQCFKVGTVQFEELLSPRFACSADADAAPQSEQIFLVVTLDGHHPGLAEHFVKHYLAAGIKSENMIGLLNVETREELQTPHVEEVKEVLRKYKIQYVTWTMKFIEMNTYHVLHLLKLTAPTDWIVYADMDEFTDFQGLSVRDWIDRLNAGNYNVLRGGLYDRVSPDGSLLPVRADVSLHEQFPHTCVLQDRLEYDINRTVPKIVMTRGDLRVGTGHHFPFHYPPENPWTCFKVDHLLPANWPQPNNLPLELRIDHFKWTEGRVDYLASRAAHLKGTMGSPHAPYLARSVSELRKSHNRIDVAKYCNVAK